MILGGSCFREPDIETIIEEVTFVLERPRYSNSLDSVEAEVSAA